MSPFSYERINRFIFFPWGFFAPNQQKLLFSIAIGIWGFFFDCLEFALLFVQNVMKYRWRHRYLNNKDNLEVKSRDVTSISMNCFLIKNLKFNLNLKRSSCNQLKVCLISVLQQYFWNKNMVIILQVCSRKI